MSNEEIKQQAVIIADLLEGSGFQTKDFNLLYSEIKSEYRKRLFKNLKNVYDIMLLYAFDSEWRIRDYLSQKYSKILKKILNSNYCYNLYITGVGEKICNGHFWVAVADGNGEKPTKILIAKILENGQEFEVHFLPDKIFDSKSGARNFLKRL